MYFWWTNKWAAWSFLVKEDNIPMLCYILFNDKTTECSTQPLNQNKFWLQINIIEKIIHISMRRWGQIVS